MGSKANSLTPPPPCSCLPHFEHVNRYWDNSQESYIAKILPGELYVSRDQEKIATTLGSCVSACIWDSQQGIGGMNHFMLPLTHKEVSDITWGNAKCDATRYGNYAMEHLINEILSHGGTRQNLKAKVFGGGKVMQHFNDIGKKNAEFVLAYLAMENIELVAQDLGSNCPRKVVFNPLTGQALVKRLKAVRNNTIILREKHYQEAIITTPLEGDIELF